MPASITDELENQLRAGSETLSIDVFKLGLSFLQRNNANAMQFQQYAAQTMERTVKLLHAMNVFNRNLPMIQLERIHTLPLLEQQLGKFLAEATLRVKLKKEEHDPVISFVSRYMEEHFTEDITLEIIARQLNITPGYLSTYFKSKTGVNFLEYVNEFRINKAVGLLKGTDLRVQEIAGMVGYQNMNSFNRMFKRFTGSTPTEYRRATSDF